MSRVALRRAVPPVRHAVGKAQAAEPACVVCCRPDTGSCADEVLVCRLLANRTRACGVARGPWPTGGDRDGRRRWPMHSAQWREWGGVGAQCFHLNKQRHETGAARLQGGSAIRTGTHTGSDTHTHKSSGAVRGSGHAMPPAAFSDRHIHYTLHSNVSGWHHTPSRYTTIAGPFSHAHRSPLPQSRVWPCSEMKNRVQRTQRERAPSYVGRAGSTRRRRPPQTTTPRLHHRRRR